MSIRTRKLIGTIVLLLFVAVYAILVMALGSSRLLDMNGFVTLWWVMRFGEPKEHEKGNYAFEGRYQRGNLETAHVMFNVRAVTPEVTVLKFDLLIGLPIPAPEENVDEELRDAAADAVHGAREKSERAARAAEGALGVQ